MAVRYAHAMPPPPLPPDAPPPTLEESVRLLTQELGAVVIASWRPQADGRWLETMSGQRADAPT